MVKKGDQVSLTLGATVARDEGRLLERHGRTRVVDVFEAERAGARFVSLSGGCRRRRVVARVLLGPGVVAEAVEKPARRRAALGKVVGPGWVDDGLPKVAVRLGDEAVVDARELAVGKPRQRRSHALIGHPDIGVACGRGADGRLLGFRVKDPAHHRGSQLLALCQPVSFRCDVLIWWEKEEDVPVRNGQVENDFPGWKLVTASHMTVEPFFSPCQQYTVCHGRIKTLTIISTKPYDIFGLCSPPRHDSIPLVLIGVPGELVAAPLHPLIVHFDRRQRQDQPVFAQPTIMNHARKRGLIPALLCLPAVRVDCPHDDIHTAVRPVTAGLIREAHHFSGLWVKLGMGRERRTEDLAVEVVAANRLERDGVHRERRAVLLEGEEHAAPENDVGVCHGADDALDALVVGEGVTVAAKEAAAGAGLSDEAVGAHVALAQVGVAAGDADGCDSAVAIEVDVVLEQWWKPAVGLNPEECAVNIGWDRAAVLEVQDVALEAGRLVHRGEGRRAWEFDGGCRGEAPGAVIGNLRRKLVNVRHCNGCR